jgi:serine/threonine protein kinase
LGNLDLAYVYSIEKPYEMGKRGTPYYYSPEIWNERMLTKKGDIWAMGVMGIYLFFNRFMIVFDRVNGMSEEIYKNIFNKGLIKFDEP